MVASPESVDTRAAGPTVRLQGVEGLRALAVFAVLVYHNWHYATAGQGPAELGYLSRFVLIHLPVGVTLFFVLSGFLLYRPIASRVLNRRPLPDVRNYFRNRALRLIPAYWVILFVTAVLVPATLIRLSPSELGLGRLIEQPTVFARNAVLMQNYFPGSMDTGIAPAWSLAVEVIFYLSLPLLGLLAAGVAARTSTRPGRTIAVLIPPVVMVAVGSLTAGVTSTVFPLGSGSIHTVLVRSFLNYADLFAFGMALAIVMVSIEDGVVRLPAWWRIPAYVALGLLVVATVFLVDRQAIASYQGAVIYDLLTGTAAMLLLALTVLPSSDGSTSILTRVLRTRPLVAIGLISYSLFLWHEPVQRWADEHGLTRPGATGFWVNLVVLGCLSVSLAALSYRFVERPALARKRTGGGVVEREVTPAGAPERTG